MIWTRFSEYLEMTGGRVLSTDYLVRSYFPRQPRTSDNSIMIATTTIPKIAGHSKTNDSSIWLPRVGIPGQISGRLRRSFMVASFVFQGFFLPIPHSAIRNPHSQIYPFSGTFLKISVSTWSGSIVSAAASKFSITRCRRAGK